MPKRSRPDQDGEHQGQFKANKKIIYATQDVCGICGQPVDFNLKFPHPLSPCVDHIIPVAKGGHPSDITNLQLAHLSCNRAKSDKLYSQAGTPIDNARREWNNRLLPHCVDWKTYRPQ